MQRDIILSRAEQSRAEQSRAEQSRAEQSRAEQSRAEQSRAEQSRAEQITISFLQNKTPNSRSDRIFSVIPAIGCFCFADSQRMH